MVLDEEALEAMLRRQRAADDDGHSAPPVQLTARTEEFEVYERPKPVEEEPASEPDPEPEMEMDIPVFDETIEQEPDEEVAEPPAPEPTPEPRPAAPPEAPRRPQVWPPINRSHAPQGSAATQVQPTAAAVPPVAPTAGPNAQPPRPTQNPGKHTPTPQAGSGSGCRIGIVHCCFNHEITDRMLQAAKDHATAAGAEIVAVLSVPGVYDAALAAQTLARRGDVDGVVVIGAVVTGDTKHDEVITFATAHKLLDIACAEEVPIGLGITGPGQSWAEAEARIGNAAHAVQSVVEQWQLLQRA